MEMEARRLGLSINWAKTKIKYLGDLDEVNQYATVQGNHVEVVESFIYLSSLIRCSGSSKPEIKRRANLVREAVFVLDQNIMAIQHYARSQVMSLQYMHPSDIPVQR